MQRKQCNKTRENVYFKETLPIGRNSNANSRHRLLKAHLRRRKCRRTRVMAAVAGRSVTRKHTHSSTYICMCIAVWQCVYIPQFVHSDIHSSFCCCQYCCCYNTFSLTTAYLRPTEILWHNVIGLLYFIGCCGCGCIQLPRFTSKHLLIISIFPCSQFHFFLLI